MLEIRDRFQKNQYDLNPRFLKKNFRKVTGGQVTEEKHKTLMLFNGKILF
jgi:hypothetical protein